MPFQTSPNPMTTRPKAMALKGDGVQRRNPRVIRLWRGVWGLVPPQKPHMHKIVMEISRYKNE